VKDDDICEERVLLFSDSQSSDEEEDEDEGVVK